MQNEYSQELRTLEQFVAKANGTDKVKYPNGIWIRTLDERRDSRTVALFHIPGGTLFPMHTTEQVQIINITEGTGIYFNRITGERIDVSKSDVIKVLPDTAFQFEGTTSLYGIIVIIPNSEAS